MREFATPLAAVRGGDQRQAARAMHALLAMALLFAAAAAGAADDGPAADGPAAAGPKPNWLLTPTLALDGTYTDNVNATPNKQADFITRLSPGVRLEGRSARAEASVNYQWQQYAYADTSARNNLQRALAANGRLELVERWLFLEGSHNIAQQTTSAFAKQGVGNELVNANRSETAAYRLSPYIQGVLGGAVEYQLRYGGSHTRSETGTLSGSATTTRSWTGQLAGATPFAALGWSLNADHQVIGHNNGFDSRSQNAFGSLTWMLDPQFRLLLNAGRASDNLTSAAFQTRNTTGIGVDWAPTERTNLALRKGRNTAGNTFSADFSHRTALTAWKFSDSRDVRIPTAQMALVPKGTVYDLLYLQLASAFPDPAARATEATRQLTQAGIAADAPVYGALMTSQPYVERRQQASVALIGINNTVTFAVDRGNSQRMGSGAGLVDDFALSPEIRQSGFNASWAHKLTPHAALTVNARTARNSGSGNLQTSIKSVSVLLTAQVGYRTTASLGLRQSRFDGAAGTDYNEQALTGALLLKF